MKRGLRRALVLAAVFVCTAPAFSQLSQQDIDNANRGIQTEAGRDPAWLLAEHRKVEAAIAALKPQRPGTVDAYVVVAGLDGDPVFGREAAETARVLSRRYDAIGRSVLLAAGSGANDKAAPHGSPSSLATILAAVAGKMDQKEDVLILYTTSHGAPGAGINYRDTDHGFGWIGPHYLSRMLNGLGFKRRMVLVSACFSGEMLPGLVNDTTIVVTAADRTQTSFGCAPGNDWTFFGDALINNALRSPQPFEDAVNQAFNLIGGWENAKRLQPSLPQLYIGSDAKTWLDALEKRMPPVATPKVGRPAIEG